MTESYVTAKVKAALEASGGDKHAAQKVIITQAVRDPTLLLGLTKPHLRGIVAARIDSVTRGGRKEEAGAESFAKVDVDAILAARPLGEKRAAAPVPPPKSSVRQASAIHQLVAAFKKKK